MDLIHIHVDTRDEPSPVLLTQSLATWDQHLISMMSQESYAGQLRDLVAVESAAYGGTLVDRVAEKSAAIPAALAQVLSVGSDGWSGAPNRQPANSTEGWLCNGISGVKAAGIPQVSVEGDASSFDRRDERLIDLEEVAFTMIAAHDESPFGVSSLTSPRVF